MRYVLSLTLAFALILTTVVPAAASSQWCEADPLLVIVTPGGALVPLYVDNGADGLEHLTSLTLAPITYTSSSDDNGTKTVVSVTVNIPNDVFGSNYAVTSAVSTGPLGTGTVLARAQGESGKPMYLQFTLDQP